jgi:hypothetical protein
VFTGQLIHGRTEKLPRAITWTSCRAIRMMAKEYAVSQFGSIGSVQSCLEFRMLPGIASAEI